VRVTETLNSQDDSRDATQASNACYDFHERERERERERRMFENNKQS